RRSPAAMRPCAGLRPLGYAEGRAGPVDSTSSARRRGGPLAEWVSMQKTKRLLVSLGLVASLLSLGCAPIFPARSTAVVLPIIGPNPSVLATLAGRDGPWSAWMYVDSGDPGSATLPSASIGRLEPYYADRFVLPIWFFDSPVQIAREGLLSSLTLGDLVLRD